VMASPTQSTPLHIHVAVMQGIVRRGRTHEAHATFVHRRCSAVTFSAPSEPGDGGVFRRDGVTSDAACEAVGGYEAGCRRSNESAGAHRSTSRPRQPTHRE
jgi:hypothetical protein